MAEIITLTVALPAVTSYRVNSLHLNWGAATITIGLMGPNGEHATREYAGPTATTLMQQLNVVNLSVKSLHRRILERLVADGLLGGTISGVPD